MVAYSRNPDQVAGRTNPEQVKYIRQKNLYADPASYKQAEKSRQVYKNEIYENPEVERKTAGSRNRK